MVPATSTAPVKVHLEARILRLSDCRLSTARPPEPTKDGHSRSPSWGLLHLYYILAVMHGLLCLKNKQVVLFILRGHESKPLRVTAQWRYPRQRLLALVAFPDLQDHSLGFYGALSQKGQAVLYKNGCPQFKSDSSYPHCHAHRSF